MLRVAEAYEFASIDLCFFVFVPPPPSAYLLLTDFAPQTGPLRKPDGGGQDEARHVLRGRVVQLAPQDSVEAGLSAGYHRDVL